MKYLLCLMFFFASNANAFSVKKYFKYDRHFKKYTEQYTPMIDYRRYIAQARAESGLNPNVCSQVGACGLMQVMPKTGADIKKKIKPNVKISLFDPKTSIQFGIYYMSRQLKIWSRRGRSLSEWFDLATASYNAGAGNIIKAQKKCGGDKIRSYEKIMRCLPFITGKHSKETITYVIRIRKFYNELLLL